MKNAILMIALICVAVFAVNVGDRAPDFILKQRDGTDFDLSRTKTPTLLIFWATWCPVCKEEIPKVEEIYDELGKKGLNVLAINVGVNDSEKRTEAFIKKYGVSYPVAFDYKSLITKKFGVMGTPTVMVIGSDGVVKYKSAAMPEDLAERFENL